MSAQMPHGPDNLVCPFHNKYMSKVCHTCPMWTHIRGKHPQSEQEVDKWGCAISFLPMLLIENAQMSRQTGAAVESFRNEAVRRSTAPVAPVERQIPDYFGPNKLISN